MNFQKLFLFTIFGFLMASFFISSSTVLAKAPTIEEILAYTPPAENKGIKDSFNINILKVEGQGIRCLSDAKARGISPVAACLLVAIDYLSLTIGSVALLIFIVGALITIASEGREDRLEKGKSAMMYSIYGILVAFTAYLITTFVQSILYQ